MKRNCSVGIACMIIGGMMSMSKSYAVEQGAQAPDFTAPAYHKGQFTSVQLSQFLGKWVVLCCYPGDFTFV